MTKIMLMLRSSIWTTAMFIAACLAAMPVTRADVVTDWNTRAGAICASANLPPLPAYRTMALVQTAVYEAVNTISRRFTPGVIQLEAEADASIEAAVAAANRSTLLKLVPSQQAAIDRDYQNALSAIPEGSAKSAGIAVGEQAGAAVLAQRADDGAALPEAYRPRTSPGVYVPTAIPAGPQWPQRKPWLLASAREFRPGPPPSLGSKRWARDYNEIKELGARNSSRRTASQTDIARFWEATGPAIYFGVLRSAVAKPDRSVTCNARLFAIAGQAMDDAVIAVFDAKHHYGFWRPVTAIRNGDRDGNPATGRDAGWLPLIDTPMHPEYPCAHCTLAGAVGAVLQSETGHGLASPLSTSSASAAGAVRHWARIDDLVREVADARVYDGVHFRSSTEAGTTLGRKIGERAVATAPRPLD